MRIVLKASLREIFPLADGRIISADKDEVKVMLSFIFNAHLQDEDIPIALQTLESVNPEWYHDAKMAIDSIKVDFSTNDFRLLTKVMDHHYRNIEIDIERLH